MNDSFNAAASLMTTTMLALDYKSHDAANNRTPGYKPRSVATRSFETEMDRRFNRDPSLIKPVLSSNFSQGTLTNNESPLAVAIEGKGFFAIETSAGTRYTRNGDFDVSAEGTLRTRAGYPVLGESGGPIQGERNGGRISIGEDGRVLQGDREIGKLQVVEFDQKEWLRRDGDTIFHAPPEAGARPATESIVAPGMLEMSPAPAMSSMVAMIAAGRAFEQAQRVVSSLNQSYEQLLRNQG